MVPQLAGPLGQRLDQRLPARQPHPERSLRLPCASGAWRPRPNHWATKAVPSTDSADVEEQQAEQRPERLAGMGRLTELANTLLRNAASLREPRGVTQCIRCKGCGTIECRVCKGTGVLPEGKVQEHSVKRMVAKWGQSVGLSSGESESDFIVSNRCTRCKATGRIACPICHGTGVRGPQVTSPKPARVATAKK